MQPSASDLDMSSTASLFWPSLMRPLGWQRVAEAGLLSLCLSLSLKLYLCPRLCAYPSFLIYSDDPPVSLSLSSVWVCLLASRKKATAKMLSRAPQVKSSGSSFQDFRTSLAATCWALLHPADGDIFDESRMNRDILRIMRRQWKKWLKIIENYKII